MTKSEKFFAGAAIFVTAATATAICPALAPTFKIMGMAALSNVCKQ